jgi:hypothetical protein
LITVFFQRKMRRAPVLRKPPMQRAGALHAEIEMLERFPGRLNLGVFSCWREYDSSVLL